MEAISLDNLAKPTGITLQKHNDDVLEEVDTYRAARSFVFEKYRLIFNIDLYEPLTKVCKYHDIGKAVSKWQNACKKDYAYFCQTGKTNGNYLAKAQIRHELYSVLICEKNGITLSEEAKVAILAHHGKLSVEHEDKWIKWCEGAAKELWKICKRISAKADNWSFKEQVLMSYRFDALRSILQFADKRASALEGYNEILAYYPFNSSMVQLKECWEFCN